MTRSDATPIQFWPIDCDTYNEEERYGLDNRCFCLPWECDDTIKDQFQETPGQDFSLLIYDEDESELDEIPYEETSPGVYLMEFTPSDNTPEMCDKKVRLKIRQNAQEEDVPVSMPALTEYDTTTGTPPTLAALVDWVNAGGPNPGTWNLDADPDITVNGNGGVSGYIAGAIATDSSFSYEFNIQFEIFADGSETEDIDVTFALLDASFIEVDTHVINYNSIGVKTPNFTLQGSAEGAYLAMRITNNTPFESKSFELQSASYVPGTVSHDWNLGATPNVTLPNFSLSETLWVDVSLLAGIEYKVRVNFNLSTSMVGSMSVRITDGSFVTQFSNSTPLGDSGANSSNILTFIANASTTRLAIRLLTVNGVTATITSVVATRVQTTGQTQVLAKSDCISLKSEHVGTLLIEYSNYRNYAGVINNNGSPDLTFYLRIPAVFNEERFPETDEPMQLSNNRIISLNSQVKAQRLLDTDQLPNYMRRKLKLVLKHQFLSIEDKDYVKEEELEELENSNKRWPMRRMSCWLTEKEYVIRNIL